jgi:hypothetical protein
LNLRYLRKTSSLDKIIELPQSSISRQRLEVGEKVATFGLEERSVFRVQERLIPERTDVDSHDFRSCDNFSKRPHESTINAHKLLRVDLIGLVQHDADFIVVALKCQMSRF